MGDVEYIEAHKHAARITPVPGGKKQLRKEEDKREGVSYF